MNNDEKNLRIKYIGKNGVEFWHGKESTLKKEHPYAIILSRTKLIPGIYDETG